MRSISVAALAMLVPLVVAAQHPQTRQGFGISFGVGSGSLGVDCTGCSSDRKSASSAYLRLGGYLRQDLFLGFESNAWVHSESGVDETVSFGAGVVQWYPGATSGLYLKAGLGFSQYLAEDAIDEVKSSAAAISLGAGYDFRVGRNFSLTPFANYLGSGKGEILINRASTGFKWSMNLMQLGLGFTWH